MAQVIVRNLDEHVVSSLKFKAELHGCSLEQELVDRIAAKQPRPLQDDSTDLLRGDRSR
jgi:antitoxin FitA